LLGKYLVRATESGSLAARIVEVEAYIGPQDRACHASRGRTKRTEVLFGPPGTAYVYLIYGMYYCFNIVTERTGYPAAVLVRAVDFPERPGPSNGAGPPRSGLHSLVDGPGRVCRALKIDLNLNRWDLTVGERLWVEDRNVRIAASSIAASPRIGVDYAGEWAAKPWRFRLKEYEKQPRLRGNKNTVAR
jgi:DNA-3-methyladenine glycosylase